MSTWLSLGGKKKGREGGKELSCCDHFKLFCYTHKAGDRNIYNLYLKSCFAKCLSIKNFGWRHIFSRKMVPVGYTAIDTFCTSENKCFLIIILFMTYKKVFLGINDVNWWRKQTLYSARHCWLYTFETERHWWIWIFWMPSDLCWYLSVIHDLHQINIG